MTVAEYRSWFNALTKHDAPHGWQRSLVAEDACRARIIRIPTGLGKTEGVLSAWAFHRIHHNDDRWPRRLVWCLPMRVLVEQTEAIARELMANIPEEHRPSVYVAMGGVDSGEWILHPERPAIIIGTQDMLLSRALNRGYASGRARWPMEFGLLNQDALWVMDEVQLMDVGLASSTQLQAFRDEDSSKHLRPCHTWWMSATLQPEWLKSVDTARFHERWVQNPCVVAGERKDGQWTIRKSLTTATIGAKDAADFARRILAEHEHVADGEFGRITLVVCNTVRSALDTYDALTKAGRKDGLELVHSRFRPAEREAWRERFLSRKAGKQGVDRIIVATQVVEAGVDISAGCLITELAPWPSLVQRFGRCARYNGTGRVLVVDRWVPKKDGDSRDEGSAAPYAPAELGAAWATLAELGDVGIAALESFEEALTGEARAQLYPYEPEHLLLRKEFDELFDTTPDLTGADLDISRFIRSGDERDLQVFWEELGKDEFPARKRRAQRRELCAVPFLKARDWLCGKETKEKRSPRLRAGMRVWVWDWIDGQWVHATRATLLPGRVVCVAANCGGYDPQRGFDAESKVVVPPIPGLPVAEEVLALDASDDAEDDEQLSAEPWKTIATHSVEVAEQVGKIGTAVKVSEHLRALLGQAATWHDWGKSHPAFQGALRGSERPEREDLAKGPEEAWRAPPDMYRYRNGSESRPGFRHELASVLGLFALLQRYAPRHPALLGPWEDVLKLSGRWEEPNDGAQVPSPLIQQLIATSAEDFDLIAYLVASHHGKVRVALHSTPKDQEYRDRDGRGLPIRGIREGDELPPIPLSADEPVLPGVVLTLSPAAMGLSERTGASWRERTGGVLARYGPCTLAYLEAILRAADVQASRLTTTDTLLKSGVAV